MTSANAIAALDIRRTLALYRARKLSPVEVFNDTLQRLDRSEPAINAFTLVDREAALKAAKASERRWLKGAPKGPLDGIFGTVKSNVAKAGWALRRGSKTTSAEPLGFSAPAVLSLENAGAILFAQTTMPEFGWIGHGNSPLTGITRNPHGLARTTGGSSAGAGAAAALGLGLVHVGTDGAGSIRIPASFCGVFGLKPSFGRVPAYPASPFGSIAHIGPLTRSAEDGTRMLAAMSAPDARDMLAWNSPPPDYAKGLNKGVKGLRIAFSPSLGYVPANKIDSEVEKACAAGARVFQALGAHVETADPGFTLADAYAPLSVLWEAGSAALLASLPKAGHALVSPGLLAMAEAGRKHSAVDFANANIGRARLWNLMLAFHQRYDLLLTPTMPVTAIEAGHDMPPGGRFGPDWLDWSPFCYPFNITMQPAASVPCGKDKAGMPAGLQIIGPVGADALVLRAATAFEKVFR